MAFSEGSKRFSKEEILDLFCGLEFEKETYSNQEKCNISARIQSDRKVTLNSNKYKDSIQWNSVQKNLKKCEIQ